MSDVPPVRIADPDAPVRFAAYATVADADSFRHPERFVKVTWLMPYYWRSHQWFDPYVNAGMLPGRVPVRALDFPEWDLRFVIPDRDVRRLSGDTANHARVELIRLLHKRLRRSSGDYPAPINTQLDTWAYRTFGEALYGEVLADLEFRGWRGRCDVDERALLFARPLFREDFRAYKKSYSLIYVDYIKWERLARSHTGYLVPYQCVEIDRIHPAARASRYVRIPVFWDELESCRSMGVDLPLVITYRESSILVSLVRF